MPDNTSKLALPYLQPAQAQKHITHNEALQKLDAIVQLTITSEIADPPADPQDGDVHLVADGATGDWLGQSGKLAFFQNDGWDFISPKGGWRGWFLAEQRLKVLTGTEWRAVIPQSFDMLGINATADIDSRFAVASGASQFSHEGESHRMTINKAATEQTASLIFKDNWTGRAEIGLTGDDNLSLKVSADGANWTSALEIEPSGIVRTPQRPAVRASLGESDIYRSNGDLIGFGNLYVNQGGFAMGALLPTQPGYRLLVPVSGLYFVAVNLFTDFSTYIQLILVINGVDSKIVARDQDNTASKQFGTCTNGLVFLSAGDEIWFKFTGNGTVKFGDGKTELIMIML